MVTAVQTHFVTRPRLADIYPLSTVLDCPECGGEMVLRESHKYNRPFYGCINFPSCRATHGAHPDGKPLGIPADAETKRWRIAAHNALDPLWGRDEENLHAQIRKRYRNAVYSWLGERLGIENIKEHCHIGLFGIERCQQVIAVCQGANRQNILAWHNERMPKPKKKRHRRPPRYAHY
jgi:ssDNA-binding Zn-finger/Zn-ribbon topoisomerase 1